VTSRHRGRNAGFPASPPQIPACGIIAPGSSGIDSLDVTGCCFAPLPQRVTPLQHIRSPRCTGCLLRASWQLPRRTCTRWQTMTVRAHQRLVRRRPEISRDGKLNELHPPTQDTHLIEAEGCILSGSQPSRSARILPCAPDQPTSRLQAAIR
jgi:hypothetical protein